MSETVVNVQHYLYIAVLKKKSLDNEARKSPAVSSLSRATLFKDHFCLLYFLPMICQNGTSDTLVVQQANNSAVTKSM